MTTRRETIRSFGSEVEAHGARSRLEAEGIAAWVQRHSRYRAMSGGGYLLKVEFTDLPKARAVLAHLDAPIDMDEYVDADDTSYRRCPQCNSVNIITKPLPSPWNILAFFLLGIPLLFIRRDRKCRKCGHTWQA